MYCIVLYLIVLCCFVLYLVLKKLAWSSLREMPFQSELVWLSWSEAGEGGRGGNEAGCG